MSEFTRRTARRIEEIKQVWEPGMSASVIAARLSWKPSRNAVIGMFHRHAESLLPCTLSSQNAKDPGSKAPLGTRRKTVKVRVEVVPKIKKAKPVPDPVTLPNSSESTVVEDAAEVIDEDATVAEFKPELGASCARPEDYINTPENFLNVPVADHKEGQCRWPSDGVTDLTYCGCPVQSNKVYCARHLRRGTKPVIMRVVKKVWRS